MNKRFFLFNFLIGFCITFVIFLMFFIYDFITFKSIPDIADCLQNMAVKTIFLQVLLWLALLPGNGFLIFMLFFTNIFGEKPQPVINEIESESDIIKQNELYHLKIIHRNIKLKKLITFNMILITVTLLLLINSFISG